MSEVVKLEVIRNTQDSLSKYINRPPLTEKLLRKPPFRYLHDITTAVMRQTGYLEGLYSQDELNPDNIKDRDAKIAFLEKLIAAVNLSTGVNITARPNKIVAGLDVAKTNELLQTIAKALEKKVDSSKAVEQVLNKKSKGSNQQNPAKKESSKNKASKDAKTVETRTREPRTSDTLKKKTKDKTKNVEKPESKKIKPKKDVSPTKPSEVPSDEVVPTEIKKDDSKSEKEAVPNPPVAVDLETPALLQSISDENQHNSNLICDVKPQPTPLSVPVDPLLTTDQHKEKKEEIKVKEVSAVKPEPPKEVQEEKPDFEKEVNLKPEEVMKRPQSARAVHRKKPAKKPGTEVDNKSPSKSRDNKNGQEIVPDEGAPIISKDDLEKKQLQSGPTQSENIAQKESKRPRTAARPASARPGAPRVRDRGTVLLTAIDNKIVSEPVNLIVDSKDLPKDDDEALVTVEAPASEAVVDQVVDESNLLTGDQGHLVSQILETQKELEDTANLGTTSETGQKIDINWGSGRQREQEAVTREVDKLQTAIQSLTRAANPLGKLIDFLQEDVESMQTELETWVANNQQLAKQLQGEERLTEESIAPLARQLEDIDRLVEEQLEEMCVVKAAIIRNDERLTKLLKTNTAQLPG